MLESPAKGAAEEEQNVIRETRLCGNAEVNFDV
jgi:hypothetical protein